MTTINRKCCVCGTDYSYCDRCGEDAHKPIWMSVYCSENCKNIYQTTAAYFSKQIEAPEAKELLDKCDLKLEENSMQKVIDEINDAVGNQIPKLETENVSQTSIPTKKADYTSYKGYKNKK